MTGVTEARLIVEESTEAVIASLCSKIETVAREGSRERGHFSLVLSGGRTPAALYGALAAEPWKSRIPWSSGYYFIGDERCVDETSPESNYRMIKSTLFEHLPVEEARILRPVSPGKDPQESARAYGSRIREAMETSEGEIPRFDLILLGLGDDGHTASLFPGTDALKETDSLAVANHVEKLGTTRITLTFPIINRARNVCFLVTGPGKAAIVAQVIRDRSTGSFPACAVRPAEGSLEWYLDADAAGSLDTCQEDRGGTSGCQSQ